MDENKPKSYKGFLFLLVLIISLWIFTILDIYTKPATLDIDNEIITIKNTLSSNNIKNAFLESKINVIEKKLEDINAQLNTTDNVQIEEYDATEYTDDVINNEEMPKEPEELSDPAKTQADLNEKINKSDDTSTEGKNEVNGSIISPKTQKVPNDLTSKKQDVVHSSITSYEALSYSQDSIENNNAASTKTGTNLSSEIILSAVRLYQAINNNVDFENEVRMLKSLSANNIEIQKEIAAIEENSLMGKNTIEDLIADFDIVANEIVKHERKNKVNPTIADQLTIYLSNLVDIKKVKADSLSNTTEDILARTYNNLVKSNLRNAVIEAKMLEGDAKTIATNWIGKAEAKNSLDEASGNIFKYVTSVSYN